MATTGQPKEGRMNILEVSAHYMDWRECVKRAKAFPQVETYQWYAAKAQQALVICQALYWGETR